MTDFTEVRSAINGDKARTLFFDVLETLSRYYLGVLSFFFTMILFTQFIQVGISYDKSLPEDTLYVVEKWNRTAERGAKIGVRAVKGPFGPPAGLMLCKYIYGMPGDVVTIGGPDGRDVFINGQKIGHAKLFSKEGKPLTVTKGGVIPPGMVYVGTPSKDSYDSRYATMGLVSYDRIVGRVLTLF